MRVCTFYMHSDVSVYKYIPMEHPALASLPPIVFPQTLPSNSFPFGRVWDQASLESYMWFCCAYCMTTYMYVDYQDIFYCSG